MHAWRGPRSAYACTHLSQKWVDWRGHWPMRWSSNRSPQRPDTMHGGRRGLNTIMSPCTAARRRPVSLTEESPVAVARTGASNRIRRRYVIPLQTCMYIHIHAWLITRTTRMSMWYKSLNRRYEHELSELDTHTCVCVDRKFTLMDLLSGCDSQNRLYCHTRFMKKTECILICTSGSVYTHTIDNKANIIIMS
jgi:hypothetical protein